MSDLLQDLRYSVRLLLKTPGFSLTAILVLALGIGANAAIFSLVNALLLKPVVGSDRPGQVVGIYAQDRTRPDSYKSFSYPAYVDVRDRGTSFSQVMGFTLAFVGLGEGEATRRTFGSVVTGNYFSTLGVDLLAGRTFTAEEERPDSLTAVTVVSHQVLEGPRRRPVNARQDDPDQRASLHRGRHRTAGFHRHLGPGLA